MKVDLQTFSQLHHPAYVLEEQRLRNNLELISKVARRSDTTIVLAFKAFALWKTFPIFREYISATTASSLYEAKLGYEEFGSRVHTFCPGYTDDNISEISRCSSHLIFNSLNQYRGFADKAKKANPDISLGLRVNPEYSEVETLLYNPCAPGSRFGLIAEQLPEVLPRDIDGFHCHCHCESGADAFQRTLAHIEEKFGKWFPQLKWINFGGGHLMTRKDYDTELLISILNGFHKRYPHLKLIMEPGSAFLWQTGPLVSQVVDIVVNHGIRTAIINVSFTCHMPDCLEMPYKPQVRFAQSIDTDADGLYPAENAPHVYRLGGDSCLSGDFMGYWKFDHELQVGENIIFEDMIHYTTVKTTMFNGISHPSLMLARPDGELEMLRQFTYDDYKNRMD
jgi:carboxynorspermidine decarboxylase